MNLTTFQMPTEVKELALKISENKQAEVLSVLEKIFAGTSAKKEIEKI